MSARPGPPSTDSRVVTPCPPGSPWVGAEDVGFHPSGRPVTGQGWEIYPEGLTELLTWLHKEYPGVPLYVTENGAAFADEAADGAVHDPDRVAYLAAHVDAVLDAVDAGADVRGYYYWSLLDNFEWAWGYGQRFGLVYVDYDTQQRIVKSSGRWYAEAIAGVAAAHAAARGERRAD